MSNTIGVKEMHVPPKRGQGKRRRSRGKNALTKAQWQKKKADENAAYLASLGEVAYIEPTAHDVDMMPKLENGQVYVFATSDKFHTHACAIVMGMWDQKPETVRVALDTGVGKRSRCKVCADETL